jgi:uncharacterized protein YndB with AHSA1/START domain
MANDFVTLVLTKDLGVPAETAWSKFGKFNDIEKWMDGAKCTYASGSGDVGSVRQVVIGPNTGQELLVSKTPLSYCYTMIGEFLPFYHGTLAVESTGANASKIVYTFVWDQGPVPAEQRAQGPGMFKQIFGAGLENMKKLAEGK